MTQSLTPGAITKFWNGGDLRGATVQVCRIDRIGNSNRFKLLVSDGTASVTFVAAEALNAMMKDPNAPVRDGLYLEPYCIVKINDAMAQDPPGAARVCIVMALDVTAPSTGNVIGAPVELKKITAPTQPPVSTNPAPVQPAKNNVFALLAKQPPAVAPGSDHGPVVAIKALSLYNQRWTIKVRVTNKGAMREYTNAKGTGQLFSVDLLDSTGGEIRGTAFGDTATRLYALLAVDSVYLITKGQLKTANSKFSKPNSTYEITFGSDTMVTLVTEPDASIPRMNFAFVAIGDIRGLADQRVVDVIGIVTNHGTVSQITTKSGSSLAKREITVVDMSHGGSSIRLTLWGDKASGWNDTLANPVVAIKACKVSDFGGKSLSTSFQSHMEVDPLDIHEAAHLRSWWDTQGHSAKIVSLSGSGLGGGPAASEAIVLSDIASKSLGLGPKPSHFSARATVTMVKPSNDRDMWYRSCSGEGCQKKVTEDGNGFRCEKCDKVYPTCNLRYLMTINVADHTGSEYVNIFDDDGRAIMGMTAAEAEQLKESDFTRFEALCQDANFHQFNFACTARTETYNEKSRVRIQARKVEPVNFVEACKALLQQIEAYN